MSSLVSLVSFGFFGVECKQHKVNITPIKLTKLTKPL